MVYRIYKDGYCYCRTCRRRVDREKNKEEIYVNKRGGLHHWCGSPLSFGSRYKRKIPECKYVHISLEDDVK